MKKIILLILFLVTKSALSQTLETKEVTYDFGSGMVPAHEYTIPHTRASEAIEKISKEIKKSNGKVVSVKGNRLEATGVQFKDMGSDIVDISANFEEVEDYTVMTCAFKRNGEYMSSVSDANDMKKINSSAMAITTGMAVSAIGLKVALAEKDLKASERERDKIKSEIEKVKSENEELKGRIKDNEVFISEAQKKLQEMDKKVKDHGEKVKEHQEKKNLLK